MRQLLADPLTSSLLRSAHGVAFDLLIRFLQPRLHSMLLAEGAYELLALMEVLGLLPPP